jgi:Protein of unknown function DUF262/Protein of unknown function (DUF1524)
MKITPTSLTVGQLLGQTNEIYIVPPYQRRYSWLDRQIGELIDDISLIEANDTHLLGSIVCLANGHVANLNELEVVDGQQRLTTVCILLNCLKERFSAEGSNETSTVSDIEKLLTAKAITGKSFAKIKLESIDASDFLALVDGKSDVKNKCLAGAFAMIRSWATDTSLAQLKTFWYRLQNHAIVIRLDVSNAKDAFKLFETINNRGLRLSHTDIIKNFLLGNAARFGPQHLTMARSSWAKLVVNLDGTNSDTFFRYYLTALIAKRVVASKVISQFKQLFHVEVKEAKDLPERRLYDSSEDIVEDDSESIEDNLQVPLNAAPLEIQGRRAKTFKKFVELLVSYSKVYGNLVRADTGDARIDRHLSNLKMIKAVQTYGFLMHLRVNGCTDKDLRAVLKLTENFVLRRHVCKERSNETEALFASICSVDPLAPIPATRSSYRELCPSDEKFQEEFATTSFPANLIDRARYCLAQIELSKHGEYSELDILGGDDVHVEHIVPQKIKTNAAKDEYGDWVTYLGPSSEAKHQKYLSRIGNLTLFAGELNIGASNNPFSRKKEAYRNSGLKLTQELCLMTHFKFAQVDKRSAELAQIAVTRWPKS